MTAKKSTRSSSMSGTDTGTPKSRSIGLLVSSGDILKSPVNALTRSGLEVIQFDTVDEILSWSVEQGRVVLIVDVPFVDQDPAFSQKLSAARKEATICIIGLIANGDFDTRLKATRMGVNVVMVRPISDERLVKMVDTFTERLTPVRRDLIYIPLNGKDSMSSEYLTSMPHLKIQKTEPRDSTKAVAAFERTVIMVESEEDDAQAKELISAIAINEEAMQHPIAWVRPIRNGGDDLAFRFSVYPRLDISLKVYYDSLLPLMEGLYELAGIDKVGKIEGFYGDFAFGEKAYSKANDIVRFGQANEIPMSFACFNIGDFYKILNEQGFDVANRAMRDLDLLLSRVVNGMDFQLRVAMDKLIVLFVGKTKDEVADKIRPVLSIMKLQKDRGADDGGLLTSMTACVISSTQDAETDIHAALQGISQAEKMPDGLFICD
jgi:DNA-binding response OmpR family regulator